MRNGKWKTVKNLRKKGTYAMLVYDEIETKEKYKKKFFLRFFYKIKSFCKWILNIALQIYKKKSLLALNRTSLILSNFNNFSSKHLLILKKSSRPLQDMCLRRRQHVFSVTIFYLPRRIGRQKIVTLKTSAISLEDRQKVDIERSVKQKLLVQFFAYIVLHFKKLPRKTHTFLPIHQTYT